ncbi:MAG: antibiotic biosynthesis monooxygenase [Clostridia bacterium]|nr:antibiotic biosynthesis monooxygenase [Clostridia bacterium]
MAVTINIYYRGENGNARRFAEEMLSSGIVEAIRAEDGNLRYEYFFPMEDQETVLLIDSWEDQSALDRHHHLPVMQRIIELREKYALHMKVERYMDDAAGIPAKDRAFIKE